jgi:hypothetical protein
MCAYVGPTLTLAAFLTAFEISGMENLSKFASIPTQLMYSECVSAFTTSEKSSLLKMISPGVAGVLY